MKLNNINKSFASKKVFNNQSFEFKDNKITYILGESGIGKTTILRMIAGLDRDFQGNILKNSDKISYVFQEPRLFPFLSVYDNIVLSSDNSPYTVNQVLKLVEMENEINALPASLSGGMKMRVALARAIYSNGDIYLMDEPFSALDGDLKSRILPNIFEMLKNKTVIIVSHNVEEANQYADEIINLNTVLNQK